MTGPSTVSREPEFGAHVAVVVVNHRTPQLTIRCVESVCRSTGVRITTIVVENASNDGSAELLRRELPGTRVVESPVNGGYAGGSNLGIAHALVTDAQYVFLLNSDATVDAACLARLVQALERAPRAALANPLIVREDATDTLWFGGTRFTAWTGRVAMVGWRRGVHHALVAGRIPAATGCALLMRASAMRQLGAFDLSFFGYAEDMDLSLRARDAGWEILFEPSARVVHQDGVTHRLVAGQALRQYLTARNLVRVLRRHTRWYQWPGVGVVFLVDQIGRFLFVGVRDRDWCGIAATLRGTWHGLFGGRHPVEPGAGELRDLAALIAGIGAGDVAPREISPP